MDSPKPIPEAAAKEANASNSAAPITLNIDNDPRGSFNDNAQLDIGNHPVNLKPPAASTLANNGEAVINDLLLAFGKGLEQRLQEGALESNKIFDMLESRFDAKTKIIEDAIDAKVEEAYKKGGASMIPMLDKAFPNIGSLRKQVEGLLKKQSTLKEGSSKIEGAPITTERINEDDSLSVGKCATPACYRNASAEQAGRSGESGGQKKRASEQRNAYDLWGKR